MIAIVDIAVGNIGSVENMLRFLGQQFFRTSAARELEGAERIIFPGVGSYDSVMGKLKSNPKFLESLTAEVIEKKTPILGICVGMQAFFESSEEGREKGLCWLEGHCEKFPLQSGMKLPHMGWAHVKKEQYSGVFDSVDERSKFYFVHSYFVKPKYKNDIALRSNYSIDFCAAVSRGNIHGVQFHPEKSHKHGIKVFENFLRI